MLTTTSVEIQQQQPIKIPQIPTTTAPPMINDTTATATTTIETTTMTTDLTATEIEHKAHTETKPELAGFLWTKPPAPSKRNHNNLKPALRSSSSGCKRPERSLQRTSTARAKAGHPRTRTRSASNSLPVKLPAEKVLHASQLSRRSRSSSRRSSMGTPLVRSRTMLSASYSRTGTAWASLASPSTRSATSMPS